MKVNKFQVNNMAFKLNPYLNSTKGTVEDFEEAKKELLEALQGDIEVLKRLTLEEFQKCREKGFRVR